MDIIRGRLIERVITFNPTDERGIVRKNTVTVRTRSLILAEKLERRAQALIDLVDETTINERSTLQIVLWLDGSEKELSISFAPWEKDKILSGDISEYLTDSWNKLLMVAVTFSEHPYYGDTFLRWDLLDQVIAILTDSTTGDYEGIRGVPVTGAGHTPSERADAISVTDMIAPSLEASPDQVAPGTLVVLSHYAARAAFGLTSDPDSLRPSNIFEFYTDAVHARLQAEAFRRAGFRPVIPIGDFPEYRHGASEEATSVHYYSSKNFRGPRKFSGDDERISTRNLQHAYEESLLFGTWLSGVVQKKLDPEGRLYEIYEAAHYELERQVSEVTRVIDLPGTFYSMSSKQRLSYIRRAISNLQSEYGEFVAALGEVVSLHFGDQDSTLADLLTGERMSQSLLSGLQYMIIRELAAKAELEIQIRILFGGLSAEDLPPIIIYEPVEALMAERPLTDSQLEF